MWKALIGAKVGETVKTGDADHPVTLQVVDIATRATARERRAFRALSTQFANESTMKRVHGENLVNIFMQAEQRSLHVKNILSQYTNAELEKLQQASTEVAGVKLLPANRSVDGLTVAKRNPRRSLRPAGLATANRTLPPK